uniref:Secreted protein n=1 Tax=Trieres chinensis TaxID=1514140 RepID=A0A7S2A6I9_TRICV
MLFISFCVLFLLSQQPLLICNSCIELMTVPRNCNSYPGRVGEATQNRVNPKIILSFFSLLHCKCASCSCESSPNPKETAAFPLPSLKKLRDSEENMIVLPWGPSCSTLPSPQSPH